MAVSRCSFSNVFALITEAALACCLKPPEVLTFLMINLLVLFLISYLALLLLLVRLGVASTFLMLCLLLPSLPSHIDATYSVRKALPVSESQLVYLLSLHCLMDVALFFLTQIKRFPETFDLVPTVPVEP